MWPIFAEEPDIVVAAAGKPKLIRGEWIKPGAIIIDVGINRVIGADGKNGIVGDVDFDDVKHIAEQSRPYRVG